MNVEGTNVTLTKESYFDGSVFNLIAICIVGGLISGITFGIATPWVMVKYYEWKINNTVVGGRRLQFHGTGGDLFLKWLLWTVLTVITLGIYGFWYVLNLEKWKVSNTTIAE